MLKTIYKDQPRLQIGADLESHDPNQNDHFVHVIAPVLSLIYTPAILLLCTWTVVEGNTPRLLYLAGSGQRSSHKGIACSSLETAGDFDIISVFHRSLLVFRYSCPAE